MSKRRLISSNASIAAILVLTAWLLVASFPLKGSPQVEVRQRAVVDQAGISVQPGGTLLHRTPVRYPAEAMKNRIEGVVVVSLSLNADGTVSDDRILAGPDELRRAVLESVLQWHYLREASTPGVVQATIEFRLPEAQLSAAEPTVNGPGLRILPGGGVYSVGGGITGPTLLFKVDPEYTESAIKAGLQGIVLLFLEITERGLPQNPRVTRGLGLGLDGKAIEAVMKWRFRPGEKGGKPVTVAAQVDVNFRLPPPPVEQAAPHAVSPLPPSGAQTILMRIDVSSLPEPLQGMLKSRLAPFEGQPMSSELLSQIGETAREVDSHAQITSASQYGRAQTLAIGLQGSMATSGAPQTSFPSTGVQRVRVAGNVQQAKLISQPKPEYPPLGRQARISGVVRFDVLIGTDGHVANMTLVSGHPLLVPAAQEAAKGYVYQPTLLNGEPVEVVTQIDVNFTLQ